MGGNKWLKITGWKQTGELERVSSFDKICSLSTYYTQKCYLTVFTWTILLNNSQKVSVVMIVLLLPPRAHPQQFFTHLCIVCVCVWEKESMWVCSLHRNSTEIFVAIRKLAKNVNLGRPGSWCFFTTLSLDVPTRHAPIFHVDHVRVRVCLPACLCMSITTSYSDE